MNMKAFKLFLNDNGIVSQTYDYFRAFSTKSDIFGISFHEFLYGTFNYFAQKTSFLN